MIVKTFVNEVDISRIYKGQLVEVGVDAFPDKNYNGEVVEVANIGETKKESNANVFDIVIDVKDTDSILRPAMTTKNSFITAVI